MIEYDTRQVLTVVPGMWRASLLIAGLVVTVIVGMMTLSKGADCSVVCHCEQSTYLT